MNTKAVGYVFHPILVTANRLLEKIIRFMTRKAEKLQIQKIIQEAVSNAHLSIAVFLLGK